MSAEDLRKSGNALYVVGRVDEESPTVYKRPCGGIAGMCSLLALILYQRAAALAPTDPAPLRNISAAYFELG